MKKSIIIASIFNIFCSYLYHIIHHITLELKSVISFYARPLNDVIVMGIRRIAECFDSSLEMAQFYASVGIAYVKGASLIIVKKHHYFEVPVDLG